jgi:hypothetical protein
LPSKHGPTGAIGHNAAHAFEASVACKKNHLSRNGIVARW